uniref:FAR1 domain-containing protein n=1 Tax=Oryza glumipatula TaxID=40148 RepID=A0A0D9Y7X4_9ORYZ
MERRPLASQATRLVLLCFENKEDGQPQEYSSIQSPSPVATSNREHTIPNWVPQIEMTFSSVVEAQQFSNHYGGQIGFDNTSKLDGKATSAGFVCNKERFRTNDKRDHLIKTPRAVTNCMQSSYGSYPKSSARKNMRYMIWFLSIIKYFKPLKPVTCCHHNDG